ncbi:MAG: hypothetical protein WD358_00865 [Nitriliruptoraceae bacterium]
MTTRLAVERDAALPLMAWVAYRQRGDSTVQLRCGGGVEVGDRRWVEGAWTAPFDEWGLASSWLAGSAGLVDGEDLVVVPPGHTLEGLWVARTSDDVTVANSLPLLLAATNLQLDDAYPHYLRRFLDVIYGLPRHDIRVPTTSGVDIHLMVLRALRIHSDLAWTFEPPWTPGPFRDFSHYRASLVHAMQQLTANAAAGSRRRTFEPLATLSSGYDSPACAVIAGEAGCRRAVTISRGRDRADRSVVDDSGADLAEPLDMEVIERPRVVDLSVDGEVVADEFWATGMSGEDIVMRVFDDVLPGSLLVTGFYGDTLWSPTGPVSTTLRRVDVAGASMGEFRLRLGFVHVPLPFFGAMEHPSIKAISTADEIASWRLNVPYDRPIPRRIVEQHGIARASFGREKKATTTIANRRIFDDTAVCAAIADYAHRRGHTWRTRVRHKGVDVGFRLARPLMRVARPIAKRAGWRIDVVRRQSLHGPDGTLVFLWAVDHLRHGRYEHIRASE